MDWKVRLIFAILALTLINAYFNPGRKIDCSKCYPNYEKCPQQCPLG